MNLQWHLSFALMCLYVWGGIFQPDHLTEKWNNCEGHFYKGWTHLRPLLKKASVDLFCRCNEKKCISIAIFPTLKYVPVFWAYKISHKGDPVLSEHNLLKNITTWYISPSVRSCILSFDTVYWIIKITWSLFWVHHSGVMYICGH